KRTGFCAVFGRWTTSTAILWAWRGPRHRDSATAPRSREARSPSWRRALFPQGKAASSRRRRAQPRRKRRRMTAWGAAASFRRRRHASRRPPLFRSRGVLSCLLRRRFRASCRANARRATPNAVLEASNSECSVMAVDDAVTNRLPTASSPPLPPRMEPATVPSDDAPDICGESEEPGATDEIQPLPESPVFNLAVEASPAFLRPVAPKSDPGACRERPSSAATAATAAA
ncbi:unnamed protein product, partial [Phaeothamnion confervicola]